MDHDQLDTDSCLQGSNNEFEFVEVKVEAPEELDADQDQLDSGCSLPESNNEVEFFEMKMETPEELDVEQIEPYPVSEVCNEGEPFIRDPLSTMEETEHLQDNRDPLSSDLHTLEHSSAEKSWNPVSAEIDEVDEVKQEKPVFNCPKYNRDPLSSDLHILGHSSAEKSWNPVSAEIDKLEPEKPASSPVYSCPKYEAKPLSDDSPPSKHIADNDDDQSGVTFVGGSSPASSPFFRCTRCYYRCTRLTDLNQHIRTHHVAAEWSEKGVRLTEQSTSEHLPRSNKEMKLPICEICGYKTKKPNDLRVHLRKHTGERPFSCELCDFKSITSSYLKVHLRKHTGEKPFSCKLCEYKTNESSSLKVHMRRHTGEKPFICDLCGVRAVSLSNLKVHMRKHTGERPYSCEFCEYKSSQLRYLRRHMKRHKGEEKPSK